MKLFNNIFEAMEARRRRENRFAAMIFGGGCLVLIVLAIIIGIVTSILNAVETASVNQIYGDTYASACQPVPSGTEAAANLPDAASPRRILLLAADLQRRHAWHSQAPEQWRADSRDAVVLIGCVAEERIIIETCEYVRGSSDDNDSYTVRIRREQHQATIVLIDAQTARRIDSFTVTGAEPAACPEDDSRMTSGEQQGADVTWSDFASWIEEYIF